MLGMFTAVLADVVFDLVVYHRWNGPKMRMLAPFYVNLDVVSLFKVSKMKRSTFAHHVAVGLFGIVVELNPAHARDAGRGRSARTPSSACWRTWSTWSWRCGTW